MAIPDSTNPYRLIGPSEDGKIEEAIVFGSAFHIPTRVQFDKPQPGPWSQTAAPYLEWRTEKAAFPLDKVVEAWSVATALPTVVAATVSPSSGGGAPSKPESPKQVDPYEDEIPF